MHHPHHQTGRRTKNCVRVCLFSILNKDVRRKVSVEIRKINGSYTFLTLLVNPLSSKIEPLEGRNACWSRAAAIQPIKQTGDIDCRSDAQML
jgi:hypothetical protein